MLDIYDGNREKTGRLFSRGQQLAKGDYQLAASVALINGDCQCLMTRRHPMKKMGLMWELPGGAVELAETSQRAAIREIQEEVGYLITQPLGLLGTTRYDELALLTDVFIYYTEVELETLVLQQDEVVEARCCSFDLIAQMNEAGQVTPFDWLACQMVKEHLKDRAFSQK